MFCRRCGGRIEEGWICCPNCGEEVYVEKRLTGNGLYEKNIKLSSEEAMFHAGSTVTDTVNVGLDADSVVSDMGSAASDIGNPVLDADERSTVFLPRNILRILAIIALVCFFCPLFMVSCAGEELLTMSGTDLTFGFECMEEEMEGNLIYGTLALFPLLSFGSLFGSRKKGNIKEKCEQLKEEFCSSAAAAGATIVMIRYFKNSLIDAFKETAIDITPCTALHIMSVVCTISLFLGGYQAYQIELYGEDGTEDKVVVALKCCGKILVDCICLVFFALVVSHFLGGLGLDAVIEEIRTEQPALMEIGNRFSRI